MELFAKFILVEGIRKRLIKFFFVEFIGFNEETFNFVIIILFPRFEFKDSKYLDFSDRIKSIDSEFPFVK